MNTHDTDAIRCDNCGHLVPEDEAHVDEVIECDACADKRAAAALADYNTTRHLYCPHGQRGACQRCERERAELRCRP